MISVLLIRMLGVSVFIWPKLAIRPTQNAMVNVLAK